MIGTRTLVGVVVSAIGLVAVARSGYRHKPFDQTHGSLNGDGRFVIQVDDFGNLWDPAAARDALAYVERVSKATNTIVTVFVHGWHHDAAPDDKNARDFGQSMDDLATRLGEELYTQSRLQLTGDPGVSLVGIYIGWRGRSLPGWLDYLTFWGRKQAAERVGQGDVREFLLRLRSLYHERNAQPAGSASQKPFMGLVLIGHSFGGQVVFQAVNQTIEQELVRATSTTGEPQPLRGFGDLVVLLNPALEAHQFKRIDALSRQLTYDHRQVPVMLVLSAVSDSARLVYFPLGRRFDLLRKPSIRSDRRELWLQALGAYAPQVTHELNISNNPSDSFEPEEYRDDPRRIIDADLTVQPRFDRVELVPTAHHRPFHPFLVVNASRDVILGHSGIFRRAEQVGSELHLFLTKYIALVQGKRVLLERGVVGLKRPT
jgi:pimeloyl-ACP methyl ester carboxylesterase